VCSSDLEPLAEKRGIEICLIRDDIETPLEKFLNFQDVVRADNTRLKQVLLNLLSNAVKYNSENGKLTITCDFMVNKVRLSVSDTGAGLSQDQQRYLFKAFNRLGAEQTAIEGTGIGLVITKNIVELMGGYLGVDSELGVGSTFWVELPTDAIQPLEELDSYKADVISTQASISQKHKKTVLYIEDNPANLRLVAQVLGLVPDLHMWSAHEPLLGLELAMEHKPHLILLDINLPGMDGYEVLKLLKRQEATQNTPVIAISANAMPKDVERGLKAGFDNYLTKPIDIKELLETVNMKLSIS